MSSSPYTGGTQGVAFNSNQSAYVSSNNWLAGYASDWTQKWRSTNVLSGLPPAENHLGDVAYYNGKLIGPVANWQGNCVNFTPVVIAVYDAANGSLLTWSDISADGVSGSSIAIIPEQNKVVVASYCDLANGFSTLWVYDLNTLLSNPPGSTMTAISTIHMSTKIPWMQGISWNSNLRQFLVSTINGGNGGSLWYVAADGTVSGPAYVVPAAQFIEMEGVDFTTGNIYYLEGGYVTNIGAPPSAPTFNMSPGSYTSAQTVTLSTTTANAVIQYTTDGSLPVQSSPTYTGPISVSATQTLRAIATNAAALSSPMTSATYTIQ